jgi:peptidoglycan/LPS O-acetylase OafA/YrhL
MSLSPSELDSLSAHLDLHEGQQSRRALPAHIPALDGIRGLAVLLVLYCHATLIEPSGALGKLFLATSRLSWTGVDLFFVLSGFLITGILYDAKGKDHFFRNFYARRTVRIFPLYYVFLLLTLVILPRLLPAHVNEVFSRDYPPQTAWYWLYLSNFYQSFHMTHHLVFVSWSLAIEEQFYLCWPLVVFLLHRRALMRVCGAVFVGSLLLRVGLWLPSHDWRMPNNFTFCRLDGLAAGAWIALWVRSNVGGMRALLKPAKLVGAGAALALLAVVLASYKLGWRGGIGQSPAYVTVGYSILALLFGALLVIGVSAEKGSTVGRIFNSRFLSVFGKYSYAVYLLHWPVVVMLQHFVFDPTKATGMGPQLARQGAFYLLSGTTVLALSWVSWHVLEKHFLKLKDLFPMATKPSPAPAPASGQTIVTPTVARPAA